MSETREYILGTKDAELARLEFQHGVWASSAARAWDRAGIEPGMDVLDLGSGPGFATRDLAERVGSEGSVVALDQSPVWRGVLEATELAAPAQIVEGRIEEVDLGDARFDAIYSRWVLSFLSDLDGVAAKLRRALRPGGVLVVQDYNHEGVSLFPKSPGFDATIRAARAFYSSAGGDAWVQGRLPGVLRRAGLTIERIEPEVRCGGPASDVWRWGEVFFTVFADTWVEQGFLTSAERDRFLVEWEERRRDPDALFFSPMVVDVVARRPA